MILVVDDKSENLITLQKTLKSRGFETETALSGEEALKKIIQTEFKLIILDVQMPGMDGFEVAEAIGGFSKIKDIPIIFLSAVNVNKEFITKGYAAGARDYLVKPFDIDILILKIKTFIRLHQQTIELSRMQETLLEEIEQRKLAESKKDEFISIASHELNTPLTSLKGYLQLAERTLKSGDFEKSGVYLAQTKSQSDKLHRLVGDLLDSTKIQAGRLNLVYSRFDFESFLQSTIDIIHQSYPGRKIAKLGLVEQQVYADQVRLEQVLINYLTNAIKYAPDADQVFLEVNLLSGSRIEVRVKDQGMGIPIDKQARLFDKFYRAEEALNHFQGLGMGLYICAEIVKQHHGEYGVESEPGKGSSFYFRIPINCTEYIPFE